MLYYLHLKRVVHSSYLLQLTQRMITVRRFQGHQRHTLAFLRPRYMHRKYLKPIASLYARYIRVASSII